MAIDTSAINTILNAYLQGRGIAERQQAEITRRQERAEAEQTRQKERAEDLKVAEQHYKDEQEYRKKAFDLQTLMSDLQFRELVGKTYQESGGTILPPKAKLQGTQFADLQP